jgi:hypothetical protein
LASLALTGNPAQAITLHNFSFSNVEGTVPGMVAGTITLPDGDGTFAASSVTVTTAPNGLGYDPTGFNFTSVLVYVNKFSVVNGIISKSDSNFAGFFNGSTALGLNYNGITFLDYLNVGNLGNPGVRDSSSSTLTYSATAVPWETDSLSAIGSTILFGLGLWGKRKLAQKQINQEEKN